MLNTKKPVLFLISIITVILGILLIFLEEGSTKKQASNSSPKLSQQPTTQPTKALPVVINPTDFNQWREKMINKTQLSENDTTIKNKLISEADSNTGLIYTTNDFSVFYYDSVDEFDVQILSANIQQTKQEAASWFLSQGLSQAAICNLPASFSLSSSVLSSLQGKTTSFSKLPEGC